MWYIGNMALGSAKVDGPAFTEFVNGRCSTRVFKSDPLDREVVVKIVEDAIQAPSSCNRQLWHFVVVDDPEVKVRLCEASDAQQSYLHDSPALVAIFYDTSLEPRNPCSTAQVSVGMVTYGLLLAAEAHGVGAIYLGGIRNPRGANKALGVPSYWANYGYVCLGHRADNPPAPIPREAREVISWNRYDLPEKRYHMDIRPHLWSLTQLADFRDKLLWYKGIAIDGKTLHVDPDPRFSRKFHLLATRAGQIAASKPGRPVVLDILSLNGDLMLQLVHAFGPDKARFLAYDLTEGIGLYMAERFRRLHGELPYEYLCNPHPDTLRLPLEDASVDVITCYERLDQFENPEPLLRELRRVLRPDGRALIMVSGRYYPHMYRYRRMRKKNYALGRNWNRGPERKYTPEQMRRHLTATGFAIREITGYQPLAIKLYQWGEKILRKLGCNGAADRAALERSRHWISKGAGKFLSSSILYEVSPEP